MHNNTKSFGRVFVTRMIGIISLLIAIVLANILKYYISNPIYNSGVAFINENFWLLMLIAIILFVGAIFGAFPFPFNLPAPIIRAFGSVFCIMFLLQIFEWMDKITSTTLSPLFSFLSPIIAALVFLIVLASGYFEIMRKLWWQPHVGADGQIIPENRGYESESPGISLTDVKSWDEIGAEFRLMLFDIIHRFRMEIKRKQ